VKASSEAAGRLAPLLSPRSVAIIGASGDLRRIGGRIVGELQRFGFPGKVFPVNPKYDRVAGFRCWPSLAAIPADEEIDVAIVYLGVEAALEALRQCAERGVRSVVMITSGFAEVGGEGEGLQRRLVEVAREAGMAVAGPNTAGVANFAADFVAYGTTSFDDLHQIVKGPVALVSQSGGIGNAVFVFCQERKIGFSALVGSGNEAVTTAAEYVEHFVEDPSVGVILGFIEGIREPGRFFAAADRAAELRKPIVVLKGGRSETGRAAVLSHTAALGGSPRAYAGAFLQHGVVQVTDLDDLVSCAMLFSRSRPTAGRRLGILSLPGGGTGLTADLAADHGFEVPQFTAETDARLEAVLPALATVRNPIDPTAGFGRDSERLRETFRIMARDPNVDVVVFFPLAGEVEYSQKLADDLIAVAPELGKPVVCIWTAGSHLVPGAYRSLNEAGIPLFHSTDLAFRTMAHARRYAEFLERLARPGSADRGPAAGLRAPGGAGPEELLRTFGIRTPRRRLARTAAEASEAAGAIGGRVALKVVSADVPHKTEAGGVVLGLSGAAEVEAAFERVLESVAAAVPGARIEGVEVQEMVEGGVETLLGVYTDEQLGPILTVGLGGIFTEVLGDVAVRPVPITRGDAEAMLDELRGRGVLEGARGRPPADREALVDAMLRLSALADSLRDLGPEIDLNPVLVLPAGRGAVAVDWLFETRA
jgi:acetate---CoA ligase (ADP-forming)